MKKRILLLCMVLLLGLLTACGSGTGGSAAQGASAGENAGGGEGAEPDSASQPDDARDESDGAEFDWLVEYDWEKDFSDEAQAIRAQWPDGYLEINRRNVEDLIVGGKGLRNASDTFYYYRGWVRDIVPIAGEEGSYYALIESDGREDYGSPILFYTYSDKNRMSDYVYGVGDLVEVQYNESLRDPEDAYGLPFRFFNDSFVMGWGNKYPVTEDSVNYEDCIITTGVFSHKDGEWYHILDDDTGETFAVLPHQGAGVFQGEILGDRMRANQANLTEQPYPGYLVEGDKVLVYASVYDRNNLGQWAVDRIVILESAA